MRCSTARLTSEAISKDCSRSAYSSLRNAMTFFSCMNDTVMWLLWRRRMTELTKVSSAPMEPLCAVRCSWGVGQGTPYQVTPHQGLRSLAYELDLNAKFLGFCPIQHPVPKPKANPGPTPSPWKKHAPYEAQRTRPNRSITVPLDLCNLTVRTAHLARCLPERSCELDGSECQCAGSDAPCPVSGRLNRSANRRIYNECAVR